ncbi:MAG: tetratricopeptide repeat protein [Deltaproteobacteria bacterium]|nr:MAG: tetratricopeptide repeat protein [Deltaproteobacteria bacterium]
MPGFRHRLVARARSVPLAILLVLLVLPVGCGPSDPLEKVRVLQDEKSDFRGSLAPLQKLIDARPDDPEVLYRYGRALVAAGQVGFAVWPLEKAIESPDWLEKAGIALATTRIAQGAYDEAVAICSRILEQNPDHVQALVLRATAHVESRRRYEEALADAEHVLAGNPDQSDAQSLRLLALLGLGRVEEAGAALEDVEGLYRDDSLDLHGSPALCMARATFALEKGDAKVAEERYGECVEEFPTEALVLNGVIDFFDENGHPERSEAILKHVLELVPQASSYRIRLAARLAATGRKDEAEALLRAGVEVAPPAEAAEAWATVAAFNVDHDDLDEAIEAYTRARELDKTNNPEILLASADALVMAKRFDEAKKLVDQMSVPAYRSVVLGRIELERGNPAAALKLFDEGMRTWPNNAVARYYAAIAAERLGDFTRAVEEYRYAMRIDVTETDAYMRLARLQAAGGHYEAALGTLEFEPGGRPDELAAGLLEMRIRAHLRRKDAPPRLHQIMDQPEHRGAAVAALAEGVRERSGPKAALELMKGVPSLDLSDPIQVDALAANVEDLGATGKANKGLALVDAGLRKHPDAAAFLAVRGRALQLSGAPAASVREAFEQALAIDANNRRALIGLARLESSAGSNEAALALYDRALAEDKDDRTTAREAASVLVALGRSGEAEERLSALLLEHPYDAGAARALAELRLARNAKDERTVELARRAVAFGGGAEAEALLARIAPAAEQAGASATSGS